MMLLHKLITPWKPWDTVPHPAIYHTYDDNEPQLCGYTRTKYFLRFDDDNNMSYRYILSITWTEMGQLNTYNPIYCNNNER